MKTIILLGFMILSNTINPENHRDYVESVGVLTFISIVLICLITDIMNFNKLHFKD